MPELINLINMQPFGSVVSTYNPKNITLKPFAFVLNVSKLMASSGVEIAPGHTLRRATNEEMQFIKDMITSLFAHHFGAGLWETRQPKSGSGKYVRLPAKQWRYFVIEFSSENENLELLQEALAIAPYGLEIGFTLLTAALNNQAVPVCVYRPPRLFQLLSALDYEVHSKQGNVRILTEAEGQQISEVFTKLATHDHKILDLHRIIKLVLELKDLPPFSPLQILGYFAILESILTHQPNPDDRYDSITRQITQKVSLLNRRWHPALDYTSFGEATHVKVWSKMYAYRSAIAHGTTPDFKSKLSALGTADNANVLIRDAVKQTIRQALMEPELLADLHNC
jgi:hypothetical protein